MYPQQQQPYYLTNPYLLNPSFPVTSDSSLHPPGTDPPSNSTPFPASSIYASQTADYQNWIAQPIGYDLAVGSSHETSAATSASLPTALNATWPHQIYPNDTTTTTILPNQAQVTKALRCEVCKIDVNSKDVYEKHITGKKHKKNLQAQSQESSGALVDSAKVCSVCNVVCTSQDAYNKHLFGKKHTAQVALMSNNGIGPCIAEFKRRGIGPWEKATKKIKVAQSAWCEVCKINCNSRDMYIVHLAGKKHLKNLEKLSNPKINVGTEAAAAANTLIGPQEKPDTNKPKPKKAPELDIETKKRKVVEGGAAANAIKMCTLCNVVCNSETVFNTHLSGQKHAAMVKKAGSSTG